MCLNPKYLLNPTLKKIRETGEIDLSSVSIVKGCRPSTSNIVWHSDGTISEQEYKNYVDLGIYDKSLKGYRVAEYIKCNCGKCSECVEQQVAQLTFRMFFLLQHHSKCKLCKKNILISPIGLHLLTKIVICLTLTNTPYLSNLICKNSLNVCELI